VGEDVTDLAQIRSIRVTVSNNANETPVFKVGAELPGYGTLKMVHKIGSGEHESMGVFGDQFGLPTGNMFGLKTEHLPRIIPGSERAKFCAELSATLVLTYEMNDRQWRRRGHEQPELLA
jgi:hypothetical protein